MRCLMRILLYTETDDRCHKLDKLVGRTPTVASTVNCNSTDDVRTLSHRAFIFVELRCQHVAATDLFRSTCLEVSSVMFMCCEQGFSLNGHYI